MSEPVLVSMPLLLDTTYLKAVRDDPLCRCDDKDAMNMRIGWLICAYEALIQHRLTPKD